MDNSQYPKRSERFKSKWKKGPPTIAIALGSLWILFEIIPDQWKSVWVSVLILVITSLFSFLYDKLKLPPMLKWGISLSVYGVGLTIFLTNS